MHKLSVVTVLCFSLATMLACGDTDRVTTLARAAVLGFPLGSSAGLAATMPQESPVLRRLWVGIEPDFWASTPSPDGRYVSDIDWITGDLAVIDLLTGELRRVTNKGTWDERVEWAEMSAFSPDGRRLAYVYFNQELWGYELRVIDVDGSNERTIIPHSEGLEWISVDDWSKDGGILATLYWQTEENASVEYGEMALVSPETGEIEILKGVNWFGPWNARFSPDGRFIAYQEMPAGRDDRDIFILATDGSLDEILVGGPTDDEMMDWTPDGRGILMYSDRALTKGVWQLPLRDGRPAGAAELVRADVWRAVPIGFAGETFYYGVHLESAQVHTASIDVAAGRLLSVPTPVEEPSGSQTESGEWSPDGRYLSYLRRAPGGSRPQALVIRSIAGGDTREFELRLRQVRSAFWATDSRSLLLLGREDTHANLGLFRLELESGRLSTVIEPTEAFPSVPVSPSVDRRTFYYATWSPEGRTTQIMALDAETLETTVIGETPLRTFRLAPSPDGRILAFGLADLETGTNKLAMLPTTGGHIREIEITRTDGFHHFDAHVEWTPDGRHLLVGGWNETHDAFGLFRVSASGGEPVLITERPTDQNTGFFRLSPDGRRVAFRAGSGRGEIWAMENIPGSRTELRAERP